MAEPPCGAFLTLFSCALLAGLAWAGLLYLALPAVSGLFVVGPFLGIGPIPAAGDAAGNRLGPPRGWSLLPVDPASLLQCRASWPCGATR